MRIRSLARIAIVAAAMAGCSGNDDDHAATAAARNTIAQYEPPSLTSRADYGGLIERRFRRMDVDGDSKLSAKEMPPRVEQRSARYDANDDGELDSDEWGKMMLDRFDRQDVNKDGTVTTEERQTVRVQRREGRGE